MKFKALILIGLVFSLQADETHFSLARTNSDTIKIAQSKIETLLKWHTFYKVATASCFVASLGAAGFTVYQAIHQKDIPLAVEPVQNPIDVVQYNNLVKAIERLCLLTERLDGKPVIQRGFIMSWLHWFKKSVTDNFYSIIGTVFTTAIFNGMNNTLGPISKYINRCDGLLDRTISSIFHKNSLTWFITNQVSLDDYDKVLQDYAARIEGRTGTDSTVLADQPPMSESMKRAMLQEFSEYWALYSSQLEKVLAFICYKSSKSSGAFGERMVAISSKIELLVNDFAQRCEDTIAQSEKSAPVFYDELLALLTQLDFEFDNFILLDTGVRGKRVEARTMKVVK